jgi:hypothetical protein
MRCCCMGCWNVCSDDHAARQYPDRDCCRGERSAARRPSYLASAEKRWQGIALPDGRLTLNNDLQLEFLSYGIFQTDRPSGCRTSKGCPRSTSNVKNSHFSMHSGTQALFDVAPIASSRLATNFWAAQRLYYLSEIPESGRSFLINRVFQRVAQVDFRRKIRTAAAQDKR